MEDSGSELSYCWRRRLLTSKWGKEISVTYVVLD